MATIASSSTIKMADLSEGGLLSSGLTGTFENLDRFFVAHGFGLCLRFCLISLECFVCTVVRTSANVMS